MRERRLALARRHRGISCAMPDRRGATRTRNRPLDRRRVAGRAFAQFCQCRPQQTVTHASQIRIQRFPIRVGSDRYPGLAALLVLGMHTEQNVPSGLDSLLPFFARGYLGVDFLFVLSGFIITHVYFARLASPSRSAVQIFLWHRFIRLYPVHITVLTVLVAIVSVASAAGFTLNNPQVRLV